MLKFGLSAALLVAAVPAFAQDGPPPALQQAAMAFGQCVQAGVQGLAATVTPEAGATSVLGGCSAQRDTLVSAVEAMIAAMPADQQGAAREQLRTRLAEAETQVANVIRQSRAAPAPAPAR